GSLLASGYRSRAPQAAADGIGAAARLTDPAQLRQAEEAFLHGSDLVFLGCAALIVLTAAVSLILSPPREAPRVGESEHEHIPA
ncbi:hypothetical protein, partial [Actinocorallia lasiicapitis]